MADFTGDKFINLLNENMGIAHKVSRIYFDDVASQEEVRQEMIYQLWKSFASFNGRSKFSTWMYSVCLNTALTHFRKAKKMRSESLTSKHLNLPEQTDTGEDLNQLYTAIGQLNALNKAIILLYLDDQSYDEIASITGLTRSNVSIRLVRIRKELELFINQQ